MSDSKHSTVTYTSISSDDRSLDVRSPGVIVLGYDGLPMMPEDPYAYVEAAMQEPPPSDFVPEPVYPEFMPPKDDVLPTEENKNINVITSFVIIKSQNPTVGYTDADWAGCPSTRMSTSGYSVFLEDNILSWSDKRQHTISHSNAKAKYWGVANVVAETAWIRNLL
ncbi:ribonuclease H-like domain-containing protein, partial [Tanacetum coccineum]